MPDYILRFPEFQKIKSVCFTGPRPDNLPKSDKEIERLKLRLSAAIITAISEGKDTFFSGCQAGFDIMAAEQINVFKRIYPHIRSFCIAPYSSGFLKGIWWTDEWHIRASSVYASCDFRISLYEAYRSGVFYERNRLMVDCSSKVIAYCPKKSGGTWYTVSYAIEKGILIQNLYE